MKEILEKKSKIRDCFMVEFIQINIKKRYLFFVSTKRMHSGSFAQNSFNRCPTVLQTPFWTHERNMVKKSKIRDCFLVKFNQINMKCRFLSFVSTKRIHIDSFGQNDFNRCSPVLKKLFWTYKRDIGKNQKSRIILLKYNQIIVKNRFLFLRFDKNDTDW